MTRLAARAEAEKLHRLLGEAAPSLPDLQTLPAETLRGLRLAVFDLWYALDRPLLLRLARWLRPLPIMLVAWLARWAGPLLTACLAGEMPARRAARMAVRLPTHFLADVCRELDPRRAHDLIQAIPVAILVEVAMELIARRDWPTAGRFVDYLRDDAVAAVMARVDDDEVLLRIACFVESRNRLDHLVRLLPPERLRRALLLAVDPQRDLLLEVLSLIVHVSYALKRELGDLAAAQDTRVLDAVVELTHRQGLWSDLLPVISLLSPESQRKVVNLPVLRDDAQVLPAILAAATQDTLWGDVLPLVRYMDAPMLDAVARFAGDLPPPALQDLARAALLGELWEPLFEVAARAPKSQQIELARTLLPLGDVDPALLERLRARAQDLGFGQAFALDDLQPA